MRSILIVLCFVFPGALLAQEQFTYGSANSLTYSQYLDKDYKQLQKTAKIILDQGIDFYFLRMRLGISYFETQNYEAALVHFKKAREMNPANVIAQEYLYYSLRYTLRDEEASELAETFSDYMKLKLNYKSRKDNTAPFKQISFTVGDIFGAPAAVSNETTPYLYTEKTRQISASIVNLFTSNAINNRLSLYNSFSYFNVKSEGIIRSPIFLPYNAAYVNPNFQYTLGLNYAAQKDISVSASLGVFKENSQAISAVFRGPGMPLTIESISTNYTSFTGMASIFKRYKQFGFGLSAGIGNLGNVNQYQSEGTFLWYPFGNLKLFSTSLITWINNDGENHFLVGQRIGGSIKKSFRYELKGSYGNHANYIGSNGIVAYNTIEPIKLTAEANLSYYFKNMAVIPAFAIQKRESSYIKFATPVNSETISNNYYNNLIKCTIQYKF